MKQKGCKRVLRQLLIVMLILAQIIIPIGSVTNNRYARNRVYAAESETVYIDGCFTNGKTKVDITKLLRLSEDATDTDGDMLPDEVEQILGTSIDMADSDDDGIDDYDEALNNMDPLSPDTNDDGLADYLEVLKIDGEVDYSLDTDGDMVANVVDYDNDNDGVSDGIDLSPFSYGTTQDEYEFEIRTSGEETYVTIQIAPEDIEELYSRTKKYDWPYDIKGNIVDTDMSVEDITTLPLLEITTDNMPSEEEIGQYGMYAEDDKLYAVLYSVIDEGERVALSSKVFIPKGKTTTNMTIKLVWNYDFKMDSEIEEWYQRAVVDEEEYTSAGVDTYDIDNNGQTDMIILSSTVASSNKLYYFIGYDVELDGSWSRESGRKQVEVNFPNQLELGGGVAVEDINNNGQPDIVCMVIKDNEFDGEDEGDQFLYVIGYDMDENGNVDSWSPLMTGPRVGVYTQGGGLDIEDLDGDGYKDFVFMAIDDPSGVNKFLYTIRWHYDDSDSTRYDYKTEQWSPTVSSNPLGYNNKGGGITITQVDDDPRPDFILSAIDDPDGRNEVWYYVAYNIDISGDINSRGDYVRLSNRIIPDIDVGNESLGGGMTVKDINNDGKKDMIIVAVDNPSDSNKFRYWVGQDIDGDGKVARISSRGEYDGIGDVNEKADLIFESDIYNAEYSESTGRGITYVTNDLVNDNDIKDIVVYGTEGDKSFEAVGYDLDELGVAASWTYTYTDEDINATSTMTYYEDSKYYGDIIEGNQLRIKLPNGNTKNMDTVADLDLAQFADDAELVSTEIRGIDIEVENIDENNEPDLVVAYKVAYVVKDNYTTATEGIFGSGDYYDYHDYHLYIEDIIVVYPDFEEEGKKIIVKEKLYEIDELGMRDDWSDINRIDPEIKLRREIGARDKGISIKVNDFSKDGTMDLLCLSSATSQTSIAKSFIIYNVVGETSPRHELTGANVRENTVSKNYRAINGTGITLMDINGNGNEEAVSVIFTEIHHNQKEAKLETYVVFDTETFTVPILKDYEPFKLIGMSIEENKSVKVELMTYDMSSDSENALKAMYGYESMREYFLYSETDEDMSLSESAERVRQETEIEGQNFKSEVYGHMDEATIQINRMVKDIFEDVTDESKTSIPIVSGITSESRTMTLDDRGVSEVSENKLVFRLDKIDFNTIKQMHMKWYNAKMQAVNSLEEIYEGVEGTWNWGLDTENSYSIAYQLSQWSIGEISLKKINGISFKPIKKARSTINYIKGSVISSKNIAVNSTSLYKLYKTYKTAGKAIQLGQVSRLAKAASGGSKISKTWGFLSKTGGQIAKWGGVVALGLEVGFAIYAGVQIAEQFEYIGNVYAKVAGTVYGLMKVSHAVALLALSSTGVAGSVIVALLVLSDFITWLATGKTWSGRVINAIFDSLFGADPEYIGNLELLDEEYNYEGVINGYYLLGSRMEIISQWREVLNDNIGGKYMNLDKILDENYARPSVWFENSDYITINHNVDIDREVVYRNLLVYDIKEPIKITRDYTISNKLIFDHIGINLFAEKVTRIETSTKINVKNAKDKIETHSETTQDDMYFDVIPKDEKGFREDSGFVWSGWHIDYINEGREETIEESTYRARRSHIVSLDSDGDGLYDYGVNQEILDGVIYDTSSLKHDTDGDGIDDYVEVMTLESNPLNSDTDGDGLGDKKELMAKTDINEEDTDGDGITDGDELKLGSKVYIDANGDGEKTGYTASKTFEFYGESITVKYASNPLSQDTDGDGVLDNEEYINGTNPAARTSFGRVLWDGNEYAPSLKEYIEEESGETKTGIPDKTDVEVGHSYTVNLLDYIEDKDGDILIYGLEEAIDSLESSEVEVDGDSLNYTYNGGRLDITVSARDRRGGILYETFVVIDTTKPYMTEQKKDGIWCRYPDQFVFTFSENIKLGEIAEIIMTSKGKLDTDEDETPDGGIVINDFEILYGNTLKFTPTMILDNYGYDLRINENAVYDLNDNPIDTLFTKSIVGADKIAPKILERHDYASTVNGIGIPILNALAVGEKIIDITFHEDIRRDGKGRGSSYATSISGTDPIPKNIPLVWNEEQRKAEYMITQDYLEDYTTYNMILRERDQRNNWGTYEGLQFKTGDVNAPKIELDTAEKGIINKLGLGAYSNLFNGSTYITSTKENGDIVITYDENIYIGDEEAYNSIRLEILGSSAAYSGISAILGEILEEENLVQAVIDNYYETIPIETRIEGNTFIITPSETLPENAMFSVLIPKQSFKDSVDNFVQGGTEVRIYDTTEIETYWVGSLINDRISFENIGRVYSYRDINIIMNQYVKVNEDRSISDITLEDSEGTELDISVYMKEFLFGSEYSHALYIEPRLSPLKEEEIYTIIIPEGTLQGMMIDSTIKENEALRIEFTVSESLEQPFIKGLQMFGIERVGEAIFADYTFEEAGSFEGLSNYQWYRADDVEGTNTTEIEGATTLGYTIQEEDINKYLIFEIIPVISSGTRLSSVDSEGILEEIKPETESKLAIRTKAVGPIKKAFLIQPTLESLSVKNGETFLLDEVGTIEDSYILNVETEVAEIILNTALYENESNQNAIIITVKADDEITGKSYKNNEDYTVPLILGKTMIIVTVTSGLNIKTYTIEVNRSSDDVANIKPEGYAKITSRRLVKDNEVCTAENLYTLIYYNDPAGREQGDTSVTWYKSESEEGTDKVEVGTGATYQPSQEDVGAYIFVEVIPETDSGIIGETSLSDGVGPVTSAIIDTIQISLMAQEEAYLDGFKYDTYYYQTSIPANTVINIDVTYEDKIKINGEETKSTTMQLEKDATEALKITKYKEDEVCALYYIDVTGSDNISGDLTGSVIIEGSALFNEILTANVSGIEGNTDSGTLLYQWKRDGEIIVDETDNTYTLKEADISSQMTVVISSSEEEGMVTSEPTEVIGKADYSESVITPILSSKTYNSVTLENVTGYEYAYISSGGVTTDIEVDTWQESSELTGLEANTSYDFYQRAKETTTHLKSDVSEKLEVTTEEIPEDVISGTVVVEGNTLFNETLIANVNNIEGNIDSTTLLYQWKRNGEIIEGATGNTYTLKEVDISYQITVVISSSEEEGMVTSEPTEVIGKADYSESVITPILSSKTYNSVTLENVIGYEYAYISSGGVTTDIEVDTWQESSELTGLEANTSYDFYQRVKETTTHLKSDVSEKLEVTTEETPEDVISGTVVVEGNTLFDETLTANINNIEGNADSSTLLYQWKRNGEVIEGATNNTYTLKEEDISNSITVVVSSSAEEGIVTSEATDVIDKADYSESVITPILSSKTYNSVTLETVTGYEYAYISSGGEVTDIAIERWQESSELTGLEATTIYDVYQRAKETTTHLKSDVSEKLEVTTEETSEEAISGMVVIEGNTLFDETLTANINNIEGNADSSTLLYQWKRNGEVIEGATNNTYTLKEEDISNSITVVVSSSAEEGTVTSEATEVIGKADYSESVITPILSSKTYNSVTLETVTGYEYAYMPTGGEVTDIAIERWQESSELTGLEATTTYDVYQRAKETTTHLKSDVSEKLEVTTEETQEDAISGTVVIEGNTLFSETLTANINSIEGNADSSTLLYQWKRNGETIEGASNDIYVLEEEDINSKITIAIASSAEEGTVTSAATDVIGKADYSENIKEPELSSKTYSSVTLKSVTGYEYGYVPSGGVVEDIAIEMWKESSELTGLEADTTYDFYQRVKETTTHLKSDVSEKLEVTTKEEEEAKDVYTVIFESTGGNDVEQLVDIEYESTINAPIKPIRSGYKFRGWYKEKALDNQWEFSNDIITESITLYAKWSKVNNDGGSSSSKKDKDETSKDEIIGVTQDGTPFTIGQQESKMENGEKKTIITIDREKMQQQVEKMQQGGSMTITVGDESDQVSVTLGGENMDEMQEKEGSLMIETLKGIYNLPSKGIDMAALSEQFGEEVSMKDMVFNISIADTSENMMATVEKTMNEKEVRIIVAPIDFEIEVTYKGESHKIEKLSVMVTRFIPISEEDALNNITTAVVVEEDGSMRHVPTKIVLIDGIYYAKIDSMTNSTYVLIENHEAYGDIQEHWAEEVIVKMTNSLILEGENGLFKPDEAITRGELAQILVKALGLKPEKTNHFEDVDQTLEMASYIDTAYSYGIIKGTSENRFLPYESISREDVMTMLYRTAILINYEGQEKTVELDFYKDFSDIHTYAKEAFEWCVANEIIKGKTETTLEPLDLITRAEIATVVYRLMKQAELIN